MWRRTAIVVGIILTAATIAVGQGGRGPKKGHPHLSLGPAMSGPTPVHGEGTVTPSGLRYWDIKAGSGSPVVKGRAVKVHYTGWVESGQKFASSIDLGEPFIFVLGTGQVIKGWDEGIEGMRVGGKRQLRIPPDLAYGAAGSELVLPNATLIYDIEVLGAQ